MANYSPEEVQSVVEKLVLSNISRPYDSLGTRRPDISFNEIQESVVSLLLLTPSAPFYLAFLGAQRALDLISEEAALIEAILQNIVVVGRPTFPITDISSLVNAEVALFDLQSAAGNRTKGFTDISTSPPFIRFNKNVERFLSVAGLNVKDGNLIVPTPSEARQNLPAQISNLKALNDQLKGVIGLLALALDDYGSLNLPSIAAQRVIQRARELVQARRQSLEGLSAADRLLVIRQTVLELLASKAVVKQYGSFGPVESTLFITGTGTPYSDATHLAEPAVLTGLSGPYAVVAGKNTIDFWMDQVVVAKLNGAVVSCTAPGGNFIQFQGASFSALGLSVGDVIYVRVGPNAGTRWSITAFTDVQIDASGVVIPVAGAGPVLEIWKGPDASFNLPLSYVAYLDGQVSEPFLVLAGQTDEVRLQLDGAGGLTVPLTAGAARTALQICADFNAVLGATDYQAIPVFAPLKFSGNVDTTVVGPITTFTLKFSGTPPASSFLPLGVVVGDLVDVLAGENAGNLYSITVVDPAGQFVSCTLVSGVPTIATQSDNINLGEQHRRIRLINVNPSAGVPAQSSIQILNDSSLHRESAKNLGYFGEVGAACRPSDAQEFVSFFKGVTNALEGSVTSEVVLGPGFKARADLTDPTLLYLYRINFTGSVTAGFLTTVTSNTGGFLEAGVQLGDVLVIRSGPNTNARVTVTGSITDTSFAGTASVPLTATSGIALEVGPIGSWPYGSKVEIQAGPNAGSYLTQGQDALVPWKLTLRGTLPQLRAGLNSPLSFLVTVSSERAAFKSLSPTTSSRVTANGPDTSWLFTSMPEEAVGVTSWFELPSTPKALEVGDFLEIYTTQYNVPAATLTITSVEARLNVIGLSPVDKEAQVARTFGTELPPFAKLRAHKVLSYSSFSNDLKDWLQLDVNQELYWKNLNAALNPILVNANPTKVQIATAAQGIEEIYKHLTAVGAARVSYTGKTLEGILDGYNVDAVEAVDTFIRTYKERGADRAIDLLVAGNYTDFFNLSFDGMSYAGHVQELVRLVQRLDLPLNKFGRNDTRANYVQASQVGDDLEYSDADLDEKVAPDEPAKFNQ